MNSEVQDKELLRGRESPTATHEACPWSGIGAQGRILALRAWLFISGTLQALQEARDRAESAAAAVATADSELAALEVAVPKAEMEVRALLERALDLKDRLAELKNAAKVTESHLQA